MTIFIKKIVIFVFIIQKSGYVTYPLLDFILTFQVPYLTEYLCQTEFA